MPLPGDQCALLRRCGDSLLAMTLKTELCPLLREEVVNIQIGPGRAQEVSDVLPPLWASGQGLSWWWPVDMEASGESKFWMLVLPSSFPLPHTAM